MPTPRAPRRVAVVSWTLWATASGLSLAVRPHHWPGRHRGGLSSTTAPQRRIHSIFFSRHRAACARQHRALPTTRLNTARSSSRCSSTTAEGCSSSNVVSGGGLRQVVTRRTREFFRRRASSLLLRREALARSLEDDSSSGAAKQATANSRFSSRLVPLFFFLTLWYAFNAAFNVQNKVILNQFPYPWAVSWAQLASGLLFVVPAWLTRFRTPPKVDLGLLLKFAPIAALHCSGHGLQVSSMGAGSVFFTHLVKAAEPFVGTLVLFAFTRTIAPWWVNLCLVPIVGGVAYAAVKPGSVFDISALWGFASLAALGSTVAFAVAKLLAKQLMSKKMKQERNLDAANNYAVLTCCSSALLFLPSMLGEGPAAVSALCQMDTPFAFLRDLLVCGFLYYGYNEMGFRVLDLLSPVSAAVANTLKRVVVLLAAVAFLGEHVDAQRVLGASVAMFGVLLYSIAKAKAGKLAKAKAAAEADEAEALSAAAAAAVVVAPPPPPLEATIPASPDAAAAETTSKQEDEEEEEDDDDQANQKGVPGAVQTPGTWQP